MSGIERVDGWRTSDGRIFPKYDKSEADQHELELEFIAWFQDEFGEILGTNDFAQTVLRNWTISRRGPAAMPKEA